MEFKTERGMGYCGLACVLCGYDDDCPGCKTIIANGHECSAGKCAVDMKIPGCYACSEYDVCQEGMPHGKRSRAFNHYAQEFGEQALIERLRINYENGITYHRPDKLPGDYDVLETEDEIYRLVRFGTSDLYKIMYDLNLSHEKSNKITYGDVRIIYLPPMTVATYRVNVYDSIEIAAIPARQAIDMFVKENDLLKHYPETRRFGSYAHKQDENGNWGFELCVTVPNDINITEPLIKKQYRGGLYAACTVPAVTYDNWNLLKE
ncbi:MAG: effector binding domain-containing protein, partial [Oscillospiraceae bacterium]|nr:effector binding domain-containing protein [Oscillospiraceae bacterium]